jgi:hypothetical protein
VADRVLNVVYLSRELDDQLRIEAAEKNISHSTLLLKYLKIGIKESRKKDKNKNKEKQK